jgi:hypothetical protein
MLASSSVLPWTLIPVDITPHYDVGLVDVGARDVRAYVRARDVLGKGKGTKRDRRVVGAGAVVEKHGLHVFGPGSQEQVGI